MSARRLVLGALILAACRPGGLPSSTVSPAARVATAPTTTLRAVSSTPSPAPDAGPVTVAELAGRISPHRVALRKAGVKRYRFRSRVTVLGSSRLTATYEAAATVDPALLQVSSTGIVGVFDVVFSEYEGWYRYPGGDWTPIDPRRPWRWNPAGPIYSYATAGVIAEMTLRSEPEARGREVVGELFTTRISKTFDDGTGIDVWVTDEGVVARVSVTEPVDTGGFAVLDWEMYDINGDFGIELPRP